MDLRYGRIFVRLYHVKFSYGPPGAPWVEEQEESVYPLVLRRTADVLLDRLEKRMIALRQEHLNADNVVLEIRKGIADAAIDDPIGASDLAELLVELLHAKENTRRSI